MISFKYMKSLKYKAQNLAHYRRRKLKIKTLLQVLFNYLTCRNFDRDKGPYYKSERKLKSNSSEILPINCKFICVHIFLFCAKSQN